MAYQAYKCETCGRIEYAFECEVDCKDGCLLGWFLLMQKGEICSFDTPCCDFIKLPPNPFVIHQTEMFMCEPMLDSMNSSIELDRILTREARQLREDKMVDGARRNA